MAAILNFLYYNLRDNITISSYELPDLKNVHLDTLFVALAKLECWAIAFYIVLIAAILNF